MVQFSWPVGAPIDWLPWFMRVMAIPGIGRLIAAMPVSERTVRMTFRRIGHGVSLDAGGITREDLDAYLAMLRYTDTMRNELGSSRVFVSPVRGLRRMLLPADLLAKVRTPTHFIWGEHDPFGSPKTGRDLVALLPNATLEVVQGAGHAPWLDDLDHCVVAVRSHLDDALKAPTRNA
jgi:pimeloyl-ACP methyl ester carboxylesterase